MALVCAAEMMLREREASETGSLARGPSELGTDSLSALALHKKDRRKGIQKAGFAVALQAAGYLHTM